MLLNPSLRIQTGRSLEFKMNLVNKASARTAEDTQKNHAPKINNESYTKTGSN